MQYEGGMWNSTRLLFVLKGVDRDNKNTTSSNSLNSQIRKLETKMKFWVYIETLHKH